MEQHRISPGGISTQMIAACDWQLSFRRLRRSAVPG